MAVLSGIETVDGHEQKQQRLEIPGGLKLFDYK